MRTIHPLTLASVVALALVGCGTSSTGGTGGTGGAASIAAADLPKAVENMYCEMATTCPGQDLRFSSVENCKIFAASSQQIGAPDELAYVTKGTVKYDAAKAAQCVAAIKAACSFDTEPTACDEAFQGTLEVDAACDASVECKGEASCVKDNDGCNGKCKARAALGESCVEVGCKTGLACDNQSNKCVEAKQGAEGDDCDTNECGAGLFCDYNSGGGVPKCRKLQSEGQPCDDTRQCATGLACSQDKCTKPAEANAECDDMGETAVCVSGHICALVGSMTAGKQSCLPIAKAGAACKSHMQCLDLDQYCKGLETGAAEGTCATLPKMGEACTPFSMDFPQYITCLSGYCDGATKKCGPALAKGAACGSGIPCAEGLDCDTEANDPVCVEEKAPVCK